MQVTATEAKNRFGSICSQAKRAPITVLKDGWPDTVIVSYAEFQTMRPAPVRDLAARQKEFNETYKDWIAAENARFEQFGHWSQGMVAWRDGV
jgi:prevent-host-death family protein